MSARTMHLFPDTNLALHWARLDEIDWLKLADVPTCVIQIAPSFLRELEDQKVHNRSRKLRDRAAAIVGWLSELMDGEEPISLRANVLISFIDHEPLIDFAGQRLSERVADDHLIASALEIAAGGEAVAIVTNDSGLRAKLRARPIAGIRLPDRYRLPVEEDPEQKELRDLRKQVARAQARQPKLVAHFDGLEEQIQIEIRSPPDIEEPAQIAKRFPILQSKREAFDRYSELAEDDPDSIAAWDVAGYNGRVQQYLSAYAKYFRDYGSWQAFRRRAFLIAFRIENEGSAPASNVDLIVELPEDIVGCAPSDAPEKPEPPTPPEFVQSELSDYFRGSTLDALSPPSHFQPIDHSYLGKPEVHGDPPQVAFEIGDLKHGFGLTTEPVYLLFGEGGASRSFTLKAGISCNETDERVIDLHVILGTKDVSM